jgi:hypothetical protein
MIWTRFVLTLCGTECAEDWRPCAVVINTVNYMAISEMKQTGFVVTILWVNSSVR